MNIKNNHQKIENAFRVILEAIGENPDREGLKDTPSRIARMYDEFFWGLKANPEDALNVFFQEDHEEIVLIRDIPLYSICEHHFLPFHGNAHIAYIPKNGRITGLSKLARVLDVLAHRPQLQERLTSQVADILMKKLKPQGVLVVIEAEHMCMSMRGVKKPGSITVTSAIRGIFEKDAPARAEALKLIKG
ncbi:MAG: GTP cyclohydrolase I FolE [Candidatus Wallbacteria bacterium]|nr:GTP cyclohydrolase I FolE [Candidatus Wallbacteria bacterium]